MGVSASNNTWNASNGCDAQVTWNGWSIHGMLLPYLEQNVMFNAVNFAFVNPLVTAAANPFYFFKRSSSWGCSRISLPVRRNGGQPRQ